MPIECDGIEMQLAAREDGVLEGEPLRALEDHLRECRDCEALALQLEREHSPVFPEIDPDSYELGPVIGYGGMGRIRRARDCRLGREVAIKELLLHTPAMIARFVREVRIAATLQHPGIVPLYEAGSWPDGTPFYAMRLVEGRSLFDALCDARTPSERLRHLPSVIAAAGAVAYAHDHGVLHRDLTPANILLGTHGDTVVIDWGLAKHTRVAPERVAARFRTGTTEQLLTEEGDVIGSPAYMSPEQARGEQVDERADVYALGAILYHLLAGHAPYRGSSSDDVLQQVRTGNPLQVPDRVHAGLASIATRAMARRREQRYPSVAALLHELEHVQLRSLVGRLGRIGRWFATGRTELALWASSMTAAASLA